MSIPIYGEFSIFIYEKSVYNSIHDFLSKIYYPLLIQKGITIDSSNCIKYTIEFLDLIDDFYKNPTDKIEFDKPIINSKINFDGLTFNHPEIDKNLTIYQYFKLIKKMLKMYIKSFNIDYSKTCPKYIDFEKYDFDPYREEILPKSTFDLNSGFFHATNIYCKYIKEVNTNNIKPLFIGSYSKDNIYPNKMYIYNICSAVSEVNKKNEQIHKDVYYGNRSNVYRDKYKKEWKKYEEEWKKYKKYSNSIIMKKMLKIFSDIEIYCDIFALFVVTTNPSYEKAFLLYYSVGFKPVLNIFETNNKNYLEMMSEPCSNYLNLIPPQQDKYKKCINDQSRNILMICTKSNLNYYLINYNTENTERNNLVQRMNITQNYFSDVEKFYSLTLAFSYKCSCIFDKYFNKNDQVCKDNLKLFWDYFHINSGDNQKLINPFNGYTYWTNVNSYVTTVNSPNFNNLAIKQSVLNNPSIFAFISSVSNKFINININDFYGVYVCEKKISFNIHEDINGQFKNNLSFYGMINYDYYNTSIINNIDVENYLKTNVTLRNGKNTTIINYAKSVLDIDPIYIKNNNIEYIFFPSASSFSCENKTSKFSQEVYGHAFSHIYDIENENLYYYETQLIPDRMSFMSKQAALACTKSIKIILESYGFSVKNNVDNFLDTTDNITDLTKYYMQNNKPIYNKIQNGFADDSDGTLCQFLSYIPLFGLRWTFKYNKEVKEFYLKLFIWLLYFNSMFIRQKRNLLNIQDSLQSNLHVVFPMFYANIYNFINEMNDIKRRNKTITKGDENCENELNKNKQILLKNITEVNELVLEQIILSSTDGIISAFKRQFSNEQKLNV